jgi:hypothetical protein
VKFLKKSQKTLLENLMLRPGPSRAGAAVPPTDPLAERRATLERAMGTQFEAYGDGKTLSGRLVRSGT